jgi:hypothetical protein
MFYPNWLSSGPAFLAHPSSFGKHFHWVILYAFGSISKWKIQSKVSEDPVLDLAPDSEGGGVPVWGNAVLNAGSEDSLVSTPILIKALICIYLSPRNWAFCLKLWILYWKFRETEHLPTRVSPNTTNWYPYEISSCILIMYLWCVLKLLQIQFESVIFFKVP